MTIETYLQTTVHVSTWRDIGLAVLLTFGVGFAALAHGSKTYRARGAFLALLALAMTGTVGLLVKAANVPDATVTVASTTAQARAFTEVTNGPMVGPVQRERWYVTPESIVAAVEARYPVTVLSSTDPTHLRLSTPLGEKDCTVELYGDGTWQGQKAGVNCYGTDLVTASNGVSP